MCSNLYFEMQENGDGFAFIGGEPEYFHCMNELLIIGQEFYPEGFELVEVTAENWEELNASGAFERDFSDEDDY